MELVFAYFTQPELLSLWHTPVPAISPKISAGLWVGGAYRFEMTYPPGKVHVATGKYQETVPLQKLVFTWRREAGPHPDTTVTVLFNTAGNNTEVTVLHEGFADPEVLAHHNQGWIALRGNLEAVLH